MTEADHGYDVAVLGGGASGLFTAILAARRGLRVVVLEKESVPGRKLALCGGGLANLGPREADSTVLSRRYRQWDEEGLRESPGLRKLYRRFPPDSTLALWQAHWDRGGLGLALRQDEEGKWFPRDVDAKGLVKFLVQALERAGGSLWLNREVQGVSREGASWVVRLGDGKTLRAGRVVLALGSAAYPAAGGTRRGLEILASLGIPYRPGEPHMGGLRVSGTAEASGALVAVAVTVRRSGATGGPRGGTSLWDTLLFTHRGISGPAILDIAGTVHEQRRHGPTALEVNFFPDQDAQTLEAAWIRQCSAHGRQQVWNLLSPPLPRSVALFLLRTAAIPPERDLASLTRDERRRLAGLATAWEVPVKEAVSWHEAMSWTGGCLASALDWTSLEVRGHPGFHVLGDLVALDRPCGGYSLWFCWTSARACVEAMEKTPATD